MNAYLDIHVLQTVPPANINRDDTGSPKTALYGGVRRSRVSSQAWKRATRLTFGELLPATELSIRTRRTIGVLADRLRAGRPELDDGADQLATEAFGSLGLSTAKKKGQETSQGEYLLFLGRDHIEEISRRILEALPGLPGGKDRQDGLRRLGLADVVAGLQPADIALFGRMVADVPSLNVDAACQVAHALSTHAVDTEFDYFTAVDDEIGDETGAGMIGTVEFSSATFYRYATIGLHQLAENVGRDADHLAAVSRAFVTGFVRSMPSGKQNTFANRTLPDLVWLAVRTDQPVNLVGAFETPIVAGAEGYVTASALALARRSREVSAVYGAPQSSAFSCLVQLDALTDDLGPSRPLNQAVSEAVDAAVAAMSARVGEDTALVPG